MAEKYSLSLECKEEILAYQAGVAFHNFTLELDAQYPYKIQVWKDEDFGWWCGIVPTLQLDTEEQEFLKGGLLLLAKNRVKFRYGLVGLEVDTFRTYPELVKEKRTIASLFPGLIINQHLAPEFKDEGYGFNQLFPHYLIAE